MIYERLPLHAAVSLSLTCRYVYDSMPMYLQYHLRHAKKMSVVMQSINKLLYYCESEGSICVYNRHYVVTQYSATNGILYFAKYRVRYNISDIFISDSFDMMFDDIIDRHRSTHATRIAGSIIMDYIHGTCVAMEKREMNSRIKVAYIADKFANQPYWPYDLMYQVRQQINLRMEESTPPTPSDFGI